MTVRLHGRLHPREDKSISRIRLRILARDIPAGAHADVTDLQLQPGKMITGWTLNTRDLGVEAVEGWQFRNGVVHGDQTLVVVADAPSASPMRWEVSRASGTPRVGDYHMGALGPTGSAWVDGSSHRATQGAGIPPHLTARADVDVPVALSGRALLTCWFRGLAVAEPDETLPDDPDPFDPDAPAPAPGPVDPPESDPTPPEEDTPAPP